MVVFKQFLDNCVPVIVRPECSSGMGKVKAIVNVLVFPRSDIKSNAKNFLHADDDDFNDGDVDGDVVYEGAPSELPVVPMSSTRSERL